jgi:hypothetical protein
MLSDCDDLFRWGKGQLSLSRKMMEGDMLGPLFRVLREPKGPQGGRVP